MQVLAKLLEIQGCLKNLKASIEIEDFDSANELALQFDSVLKESIQDKDLIEKDLHLVLEDFSQLVSNLQATQSADYSTNPPTITGDYIKFSFETGTTTTGEDWDIAFRGSTIIVNGGEATATDQPSRTGNGGAYIATGTFASVTSVDETLFTSDSSISGLAKPTGFGRGWYNYNPTTSVISSIA